MDSTDKVNENVLLPELNVGDWLCYADGGAYSMPFHTMFCGFPDPVVYYYCADNERSVKGTLTATTQLHTHACFFVQTSGKSICISSV